MGGLLLIEEFAGLVQNQVIRRYERRSETVPAALFLWVLLVKTCIVDAGAGKQERVKTS